MRTKNGKRIGPVPIALVAVLALAAFVSAGLWLAPGSGQTAEAQAAAAVCKVGYATDTSTTNIPQIDTDTGDECIVPAGTSGFNVELQGSLSTDTAVSAVVYAQNGTIIGGTTVRVYAPGVTSNQDSPPVATVRSAKTVDFAGSSRDLGTGERKRDKQTIMVQPAGDQVILYVYYEVQTTLEVFNHDNLASTDDEQMLVDPTTVSAAVTIVVTPMLGRPSTAQTTVSIDAPVDDSDDSNRTAKVDNVMVDVREEAMRRLGGYKYVEVSPNAPGEVQLTGSDIVFDRLSDSLVLPVGTGESLPNIVDVRVVKDDSNYVSSKGDVTAVALDVEEYMITFDAPPTMTGTVAADDRVSILITYSRELKGDVTLTVGGGDDVLLQSGITKAKSLTMSAKTARTGDTDLNIVGLPKSGNLRVPVTVEFTGDTGSLTGDDAIVKYATRTDRVADMFSVKTYSCKQATRVDVMDTPNDVTDDVTTDISCQAEANKKASQLTEATTFAPGDRFLIIGGLSDSAGNQLATEITSNQLLPSGTTQAIEDFVDEDFGNANMDAQIAVIDSDQTNNAKLGDYDIEVTAGGLSETITITVSGEASMFEISGPSYIPLGGAETFTVTATDDAGNMPSGETCFTVKLRASEANSDDDVAIARDAEEGSDCASMGESMLDMKTAMVSFTVFAPVDAVQGARGTIVVLVNNQVKAQHSIMLDDDPNSDATDPVMDGELMEPTGIRVNPLFALVNVEWTAGQSADGHAVLLFNADTFAFVDGDFLSDPTVVEYTFKGVAPGDYYVVVASYQDQDDDSRDYEYDGNGKDVTVN